MSSEKHWTAIESGVRVDYKIVIELGEIVYFSINVSIVGKEFPEDVYRVDTAHGYLHEQRFWESPKPLEVDRVWFRNYSEAFNYYRKEVARNCLRWAKLYVLKKTETGDLW